jgi:hypothetical protein
MPDVPTDHSHNAHGAERRRYPRLDVRINLAGQLSSSRIRLVNVSAGGCLVHASHMLTPGDLHILKFRGEPQGQLQSLHTRVVYAAPIGGDPDVACVAGLEFADDSALGREATEALVEAVARSTVQADPS